MMSSRRVRDSSALEMDGPCSKSGGNDTPIVKDGPNI